MASIRQQFRELMNKIDTIDYIHQIMPKKSSFTILKIDGTKYSVKFDIERVISYRCSEAIIMNTFEYDTKTQILSAFVINHDKETRKVIALFSQLPQYIQKQITNLIQ